MLAIQLIAILLAGVLDRIRGDAWHFFGKRIVDKLFLGYCMAVVAGFAADPIITPLITVAMMIGMSWGWGAPMGAALSGQPIAQNELEWWQFGPLTTNAWAAVSFRGAMWGAPVALGGFLAPALIWFVPAYAIAFPLSILIAKRAPFGDSWATSELLRGWIAALLIFATTLI